MIPAQLGGESLSFNLFILTPMCVWKYSIIILPTEFIKMQLYTSLKLANLLQGHSPSLIFSCSPSLTSKDDGPTKAQLHHLH